MKKPIVFASILAMTAPAAFAQPKTLGWSTGYYTSWSSASYTQIKWKSYTHMCYFALTPTASGGLNGMSASTAKSFVAEAHKNNVKAIICVGGDGTDGDFNTATANTGTRTTLVKNIVAFVRANGFDGLDMDWESKSESASRVQIFHDFHQELRDSLNNITPRPLMTAAIADWYPKCSASLMNICDQLNMMSYWSLVGDMDGFSKGLLALGIPKAKLGVGMGFDTDGELDVDNPKDVALKIHYALGNGYGGIMVWEVMRGNAEIHDSIAKYVNQSAVATSLGRYAQAGNGSSLSIVKCGAMNARAISYTVPSSAGPGGAFVELGLYDAGGALARMLVRGNSEPGIHTIPLENNAALGQPIQPGTYFAKLVDKAGVESARILIAR